MANELNLPLDPAQTGLTVTAILIQGNAVVGSPISCLESSTVAGHYSGGMPAVAAGLYGVRFLSGGSQVGTGAIDWDGTKERGIGDLPTVAQLEARTLTSADYFNPATDTVANVTAVGTVTNAVTLPSIPANWITAAGLAADAVAEIQSGLLTSAGFAAALPANFGALGINANGHINRVTLVDTTATNSDMRGTDGAITSIGNVTVGGYATGQSPADLVTGFATTTNVTDAQSAIINHGNTNWTTATGFLTSLGVNAPANWINAASITTDSVTKIQSGLSTFDGDLSTVTTAISNIPTNPLLVTDTRIDTIKNKTDQLIFSGGDILATLNGEEVTISDSGVNAIVSAINGTLVIPTAVEIRTEIDANSSELAAIKTIAIGARNNAAAGL